MREITRNERRNEKNDRRTEPMVIAVSGNLGSLNRARLAGVSRLFEEAFERCNGRALAVDCSKIEFAGATFLGLVARLGGAMSARSSCLSLQGVSPELQRLLTLLGLEQFVSR